MDKITIDGTEYDLANISEFGREQINNLQFVTEKIMQLNNEIQVAQTAKIGYSLALKRELDKIVD